MVSFFRLLTRVLDKEFRPFEKDFLPDLIIFPKPLAGVLKARKNFLNLEEKILNGSIPYLKLALLIALWTLFSLQVPLAAQFCDSEELCQMVMPLPQHQFYVAPEIFYLERSKDAKYRRSKQDGCVYGGHIGYDRIKRYKIYWGGDLIFAGGNIDGKQRHGSKIKIDYRDFDVEGRLGYTFQMKKNWMPAFIPFVGYGYIRETTHFKRPSPLPIKQRISFDYFTVGFLSQIYPHPLWVLGVNFKARFLFNSKCKISDDPDYEDATQNVEHKVQYRVELPIAYRLSCWCERLAVALVPFYEYRRYGEHPNFPFDFKDTRLNFYGFDVRLLYMF